MRLTAIIITLLLLTTVAFAKDQKIYGVVTKVDAKNMQLTITSIGATITFDVSNRTEIEYKLRGRERDRNIRIDEISNGDCVKVEFFNTGKGYFAEEIDVYEDKYRCE